MTKSERRKLNREIMRTGQEVREKPRIVGSPQGLAARREKPAGRRQPGALVREHHEARREQGYS